MHMASIVCLLGDVQSNRTPHKLCIACGCIAVRLHNVPLHVTACRRRLRCAKQAMRAKEKQLLGEQERQALRLHERTLRLGRQLHA